MKVTFTCEKCGHVLDSYLHDCSDCFPPIRRLVNESCPNCAKLTYGPLTEEMVAEALIYVADAWYKIGTNNLSATSMYPTMQKSLARAEARFVLRLLNKLDFYLAPRGDLNKVHTPFGEELNWRDYILDLAREQ